MASGLRVSKECMRIFEDQKAHHKYKWVLFQLNDKRTEIIPHSSCEENSERIKGMDEEKMYNVFLGDLKEGGVCRYAVYDLEVVSDTIKMKKLVFITWVSPESKVTEKFVVSSSKEALKGAFDITHNIQANDDDEVSYDTVLDKVKRQSGKN